MLYVLSKREYEQLIHKDRIKQPIRDFQENVRKLCTESNDASLFGAYYGRTHLSPPEQAMKRALDIIKTELQTLSIKLDL